MSKTCPSCLGKGSILTNAGTGLLRQCYNAKFHTLSGTSPKPRPWMGQNNNNNINTAMSETAAEPTAEPQTPATPAEGEAQPPTTPYPGDEAETQEIPPTEAPTETTEEPAAAE